MNGKVNNSYLTVNKIRQKIKVKRDQSTRIKSTNLITICNLSTMKLSVMLNGKLDLAVKREKIWRDSTNISPGGKAKQGNESFEGRPRPVKARTKGRRERVRVLN